MHKVNARAKPDASWCSSQYSLQRRCVDDAIIFHRLVQCCSTRGAGGDRHPHCSEKVGHVWANLLSAVIKSHLSALPAHPRRAERDQGECCHAHPLPQGPPWTLMKPFLYILCAIMFLCDSFLPSFASRAAPSHASTNQITAGRRVRGRDP